MRKQFISFAFLVCALFAGGQSQPVSKVWVPDLGNGSYKNPILYADYSDPDVVRVGNEYFMTSSSFEDVPGLPILKSTDLVNWRLIGHALTRLVPASQFAVPRHGEGVWAPALRYHKNEFYLYYPDPDFGIYLIKAKNAAGPWTEPQLVVEGKGLIDPCPLWDDNGDVWLVHAFAGSRAGIKSLIAVKKLDATGSRAISESVIVYDGHELDPTIEGPKFYKRNGYYYIFAPAGGVSTGWQLALRSKNVLGPYERKVVMDQGNSVVNGPHQGAWVNTVSGEDWFLHFQDQGAYGRVVHLQPMVWKNDWPVIGVDKDGDGKGEPVMVYKKPNVAMRSQLVTPPDSDEFNENRLGLQWQWMSNPGNGWAYPYPAKGVLRLFSQLPPEGGRNLWDRGNVLLQKFPAGSFVATTKLDFTPNPKLDDERTGLAIMGESYAGIGLRSVKGKIQLENFTCEKAGAGKSESVTVIANDFQKMVFLRVEVREGGKCQFSYSLDGSSFTNAGPEFTAVPGRWKGAKMGIFCTRQTTTNDAGFSDFDWFRVEMPGLK